MNYTSPKIKIIAISSKMFCTSFFLGGGGEYGSDSINDNGEY